MLARHHLNMLVLTKFIPSLEPGTALWFVVEAVGIRGEEGHFLFGQWSRSLSMARLI